jgi:hypothetical protein
MVFAAEKPALAVITIVELPSVYTKHSLSFGMQ